MGTTNFDVLDFNGFGPGATKNALPSALATLGVGSYGSYLGLVSTRTKITTSSLTPTTSFNSGMAVRNEFARSAISNPQFLYSNLLYTSAGKQTIAGTITVTASVEYPIGTTPQRITWGGATSVTIADGTFAPLSDALNISIPAGTNYRVRTWISTTGNQLPLIGGGTGYDSDLATFGNNITDSTGSTSTSGLATSTGSLGPTAIIAQTVAPSIVLVGDSMVAATGAATSGNAPWRGILAPSFGPNFATLDTGVGGSVIQNWATLYSDMATLFQYVTHGVVQSGFNDIGTNGRTAAQVSADRIALMSAYPTIQWFETTVTPKVSSTDSWATIANETVFNAPQETIRKALNLMVRTRRYFETTDQIETLRDSGLFKAAPQVPTAISVDGTHYNDAGYALFKSGINPSVIKR